MVLSSEQIRAAEQKAVELGMNYLRLMENAGSAATRIIRKNYNLKDKKVVIVCGKGNNGGDGYVIARKLLDDKASIKIIAIKAPSTESSAEMSSKAFSLGLKPLDFERYKELSNQYINDADIVIDAIFGTGFKGELSGLSAEVVQMINASPAVKIAIDVPSGLSADLSIANGISVKADKTITFSAYKLCHLLYPACNLCGDVDVVSIGMPNGSFDEIDPLMTVVDNELAASLLPKRTPEHHKGLSGTVGMFCGIKGYSGAAVLAAKAAVKSGAGIVNAIIPESIYTIMATSVPEAICTILPEIFGDCVFPERTATVIKALGRCNTALIGCGLGQSAQAKHTVTKILQNAEIPLVIDADGINMLADSIELIKQYPHPIVLTPHPKEASRLLACDVAEIQNNRLAKALEITEITGAVTVLKGAKTLIATPKGKVYIVTDGNPGMATAGTGDMLAGMISAFIAQGLSTEDAAVLSVKAHAMSGDIAVKQTSVLGLTPTDMIDALSSVFCRVY